MIYITAEACEPALLALRKGSLLCGEHSMREGFTQEVTLREERCRWARRARTLRENKQHFSSREALRKQKLNPAKSREVKRGDEAGGVDLGQVTNALSAILGKLWDLRKRQLAWSALRQLWIWPCRTCPFVLRFGNCSLLTSLSSPILRYQP